jgi:hypothetical protein
MSAIRQLLLPTEPPRPHFADVILLDRRLARLSLSDDPDDAALIRAALDYVRRLTIELDRVRPPPRCPLPWDLD